MLITASIASVPPAPFETVYGRFEAFVKSFAETFHNELKGTGVSSLKTTVTAS